MCRCAVRSSGEPSRCTRSHALNAGSTTYSERTGLNPIAVTPSPRAAASASRRCWSAHSAATAASIDGWIRVRISRPLGSQRTSVPCSSKRS